MSTSPELSARRVHWLQQPSAPAEPKVLYPAECYDMAQMPDDPRIETVLDAMRRGISTMGACTIAGIAVTCWFNLCAKYPALSLRAQDARNEALDKAWGTAERYMRDAHGFRIEKPRISTGALVCGIVLLGLGALAYVALWYFLA